MGHTLILQITIDRIMNFQTNIYENEDSFKTTEGCQVATGFFFEALAIGGIFAPFVAGEYFSSKTEINSNKPTGIDAAAVPNLTENKDLKIDLKMPDLKMPDFTEKLRDNKAITEQLKNIDLAGLKFQNDMAMKRSDTLSRMDEVNCFTNPSDIAMKKSDTWSRMDGVNCFTNPSDIAMKKSDTLSRMDEVNCFTNPSETSDVGEPKILRMSEMVDKHNLSEMSFAEQHETVKNELNKYGAEGIVNDLGNLPPLTRFEEKMLDAKIGMRLAGDLVNYFINRHQSKANVQDPELTDRSKWSRMRSSDLKLTEKVKGYFECSPPQSNVSVQEPEKPVSPKPKVPFGESFRSHLDNIKAY